MPMIPSLISHSGIYRESVRNADDVADDDKAVNDLFTVACHKEKNLTTLTLQPYN